MVVWFRTLMASPSRSVHVVQAMFVATYGKHCSRPMPFDMRYVTAELGHQPPQPPPPQKSSSASDRSKVATCSMRIIDSSVAVVPNETQEPQPPWSLTGVTLLR